MEAGTALVPHPQTGEAIDLATATDEEIVDFVEAVGLAKNTLAAFEKLASTELVERLDRSGEWTRRVKVDGITFEIKAPSPTAGTEAYDEEALIAAVQKLVDDRVIDSSAQGKTVRQIVTVEFVTGDRDHALEIVMQAKEDPRYPSVEHVQKVAKTGVNALLKIPGAKDAVEACKVVSEPKSAAERKATVKPKAEAA